MMKKLMTQAFSSQNNWIQLKLFARDKLRESEKTPNQAITS